MVTPGDFAPDFVLPTADGVATRFFGIAGGGVSLLVFAPPNVVVPTPAGAALFVVYRRVPVPAPTNGTTFVDAAGAVWKRCAGDEPARALVLSENLRVVAAIAGDPAEWSARIAAGIAASHGRAPVGHAPVLIVPDALDAAMCDRLMREWDTAGHDATGVELSRNGARATALASELKRRRDHTVTEPQLFAELTERVGRRVKPELYKAFSFKATRFEGFKIGCYDAGDGFFRRHRDNLSPATQHRRFALSLNLNDDYDGGELAFPEYGASYRPDKGGAVVFSGTLLHEALDVTRGRRFVLLSFMYREQDGRGHSPGPKPQQRRGNFDRSAK